jgi:serine protease Do/serine protease DegQ
LAGAKIGEIREIDIQSGIVEYLKVMDVEVNSAAWNAGLRKDDVLRSINKQTVTRFEEAFAAAQMSRVLLLNIERGDQAMYVLLK